MTFPHARRLFIAIPASDALQDRARRIRGKWMDTSLRWVAGRDLHVTLIPPWESRHVGADISRFNAMTLKTAPFLMQFDRIGFGPNDERPWLVWADGSTSASLLDLKHEVETVFEKEKDRRPFHLHLTLARFEGNALPGLKRKKIEEQIAWRETADSIALMESIRTRDGVEYRTIAERPVAKSSPLAPPFSSPSPERSAPQD